MKSKQTNFGNLSPVRRWTVLVCLLLVGFAIVVQAFHLHPNELANDAKHCTICQVAHAPAQIVSSVHIAFGLAAEAFFAFSADPDPNQQLDSFCLFCRPPPSV